jgi:hypothetical protein
MSDGSRARDEAEKLVAAALAAASLAAKGLGSARNSAQTLQTLGDLAERLLGPSESPRRPSHTFSNGSAECCVCPVCKLIAALRDPSPEFTERLASGASDLAAGIAGVMRAFASNRSPGDMTGFRDAGRGWAESDGGDGDGADDDPWRAATRAAETGRRSDSVWGNDSRPTPRSPADPPAARKPMAKKATRPPAPQPTDASTVSNESAPKKVAKKAVKSTTSASAVAAERSPAKPSQRAAKKAAKPHTEGDQQTRSGNSSSQMRDQ